MSSHTLFFATCCAVIDFLKAGENVARLLEDDARSFAVFTEYLYVGGECDSDASGKDANNKDKKHTQLKTEQGMEDGQELYVEISVEGDAAHDHYNFQFQFPCYILGDKLQALGFKRLIMDEIRYHGGFCDPADRTDFAS